MTRPLTPAVVEHKNAAVAAPVTVLRVDFEGAIGLRYYSDRALGTGDGLTPLNAEARVVDWGRIAVVLAERSLASTGDCTLELADPDGALRDIFKAVELQRRRVTLLQHFAGLGESDLAPILEGMIDAPVRWSEERAALRFDVTDLSMRHRATVGRLADRAACPHVAERDEGAVLPLVFGRVRRSEAVHVKAAATTLLVRACTDSDVRLFVEDASSFPQNEVIRIRMDRELIEGRFLGNTFHVDHRGIDLLTGLTTTAAAGQLFLEDANLPGEDNAYSGCFIRVQDPDGATHHRPIWYFSAETHRLCYVPAIIHDHAFWTVPAGTPYAITTWARPHPAGTVVYCDQPEHVYLLNDAPSKAVRRIEGFGRVLAESLFEDGQQNVLDVDGWVPISPNDYRINLCDTASFPEWGRPVTTVTFRRAPKELYPRLRDDRLWAEIDGVDAAGDGTGALVENPAEVVRTLLTRHLGLGPGEINAASFDAAAQALAGFRMAFTLARQADALHLCADLAFQSRCALLWEEGGARLSVLRNRVEEPALTLTPAVVAEGSLTLGRTELGELASEVAARYRQGEAARLLTLRDGAVENAFGRRVRMIDLWAWEDRRMAASLARFWLERWKRLYEEARVTTFLTALDLQRNDAVALDMPGLFAPGQRAAVQEIVHHPGSGRDGRMDQITLRLRLPVSAGCATTCETECESSGESGCLLACEASAEAACWQCETQCESLCELACTTEAELHCIVSDTDGGSFYGCGQCESACEAACETACEDSCETGCQSACEGACETACESSCQSACELACEEACEGACQVACELACETACETGCEVDCQVGCELSCETGCEVACESACETSTCETACEASCQSGCEQSCQLACEGTSCETGCEVSCQVGCEVACEAGCQTACEMSCQSGCQSGCELSCQSGCEVSCETGCETSVEVDCNPSDTHPYEGANWESGTIWYVGGLLWNVSGVPCDEEDHQVTLSVTPSPTGNHNYSGVLRHSDSANFYFAGNQRYNGSWYVNIIKVVEGSLIYLVDEPTSNPGSPFQFTFAASGGDLSLSGAVSGYVEDYDLISGRFGMRCNDFGQVTAWEGSDA